MISEQRTLVGIPFYDGEGVEVLDACLRNLDECLDNLNVDAKIVVGINGPRVSLGQLPLSYQIDKSRYNSEVKFIKTRPGLVAAEREICTQAEAEGYQKIFLTDADISRLPWSLYNMWTQGNSAVIGANYASYPPEVLEEAKIVLSPKELMLMRIFEADKHPKAREFTQQFRPTNRLKGSLLLVDAKVGRTMFGNQSITSDSRMNSLVPAEERRAITNAAFMHYARVSLVDHIQARLRHFRAAASEGELDTFSKRSLIYRPDISEDIARKIVQKYPDATRVASDFLLQCALRIYVSDICRKIVLRRSTSRNDYCSRDEDVLSEVHSFSEAYSRIIYLLSDIDWDEFSSPVTEGKGITQRDKSRVPINLHPFLEREKSRRTILSYLGIPYTEKV